MPFYREKVLTPGQLKRLSEHKYSCTSASILDEKLQPWWCWLVSKTPLWLAPNLITILGLIVNIVTTLILVWYSPDARQEPPRWACALCALGVFVYQSLDAIDGKQARRTNTQSPLGELFDHGCDSISTVFIALGACTSVKLGEYPTWMFFQCFCATTLFYCAHWQAYVTGTLRLGKVDVTEAQYCIIMIHLVSATFGPNIWSTQVAGAAALEARASLALAAGAGAVLTLGALAAAIARGGVGKNGSTVAILGAPWSLVICGLSIAGQLNISLQFTNTFTIRGCGKNGSTIAGTSILSPVIPFSLVVIPAFIIFQKSESHVYENHPALYIIAFGMVCAKVTNRLVVAHMTKSELEYLDWSLLGPAMLFLNQYFNTALSEYFVLWLCTLWVCVDLMRYCWQICLEICGHLHIALFRIPPSRPPNPSLGPSHAPSSHSPHSPSPLVPPGDRNVSGESEKSDVDDAEPLLHNNNNVTCS